MDQNPQPQDQPQPTPPSIEPVVAPSASVSTPPVVNTAPADTTAPAAPTAAAPVASVQPSSENPGQVLGIISIVLDLVGFAVLGIILGVISRNKSKEAGQSTTLGTVGMWLGIAVVALVVLFFLLGFIVSLASPKS